MSITRLYRLYRLYLTLPLLFGCSAARVGEQVILVGKELLPSKSVSRVSIAAHLYTNLRLLHGVKA